MARKPRFHLITKLPLGNEFYHLPTHRLPSSEPRFKEFNGLKDKSIVNEAKV